MCPHPYTSLFLLYFSINLELKRKREVVRFWGGTHEQPYGDPPTTQTPHLLTTATLLWFSANYPQNYLPKNHWNYPLFQTMLLLKATQPRHTSNGECTILLIISIDPQGISSSLLKHRILRWFLRGTHAKLGVCRWIHIPAQADVAPAHLSGLPWQLWLRLIAPTGNYWVVSAHWGDILVGNHQEVTF